MSVLAPPVATTPARLFRLTLTLTFSCNMRCAYCYVALRSQDAMSWETASASLDLALATLGEGDNLDLGFFGGEPLLKSDLMLDITGEARERARRSGVRMRSSVTTNGTLLSAAAIERLRQADVDVTVSIDGTGEAHDALRPMVSGAGSHASIVAGIIRCVSMGLPVSVNAVIDPRTVAHLGRGIDLLLNLGLKRITLSPNYDAQWSHADLECLEEQYALVAQRYVRAVREGAVTALSFVEEKLQRCIASEARPAGVCGFGIREVAVDPRGRIFPCERLVRDTGGDAWVVGRLPGGIDEHRLTCLRTPLGHAPGECMGCALRPLCSNSCPCVNLSRTGTVNEPDGLVCFLEGLAVKMTRCVTTGLLGSQLPSRLEV